MNSLLYVDNDFLLFWKSFTVFAVMYHDDFRLKHAKGCSAHVQPQLGQKNQCNEPFQHDNSEWMILKYCSTVGQWLLPPTENLSFEKWLWKCLRSLLRENSSCGQLGVTAKATYQNVLWNVANHRCSIIQMFTFELFTGKFQASSRPKN